MNATEKSELADMLCRIANDHKLTVLLIDHDMGFLMGLCSRVVVMDRGSIIAQGTPKQVQSDPKAIRVTWGSQSMLDVKGIDVFRDSVHVLKAVSLRVEEGEVVAIIGANGAGKTTMLRTISGLHKPEAGDIRFAGRSIIGVKPEILVRAGLSHAPEGRQVFPNLTVSENLDMGAYSRYDHSRIRQDRKMVLSLFPQLAERQGQRAGTLSGGEQQMLAVGRALMAHPRLLLLDEPSLGIAPILAKEILCKIGWLNQQMGLSVLLVEQNVHLALGHAQRAYVFETGRVVLHGPARELLDCELVRNHYLGQVPAPL